MKEVLTVDIVTGAVEIFGLVATLIGGIFALVQWRNSVRQNRVVMVDKLMDEFFSDEVKSFFYDYVDRGNGEAWFEERFNKDSEEGMRFEQSVDRCFLLFDKLCYWYFTGVINESDSAIFGYQIMRLLHDEQTVKYLNSLETDSLIQNPFVNLIRYGAYKGLIGDPFDKYRVNAFWKFRKQIVLKFSKFVGYASVCALHLDSTLRDDNGATTSSDNDKVGRISDLVRGQFKDEIVNRSKSNNDVLQNLCDERYSKQTFGICFPVLMKLRDITDRLYRRYYVNDIDINGVVYRLCNNWFERNRGDIEKWLHDGKSV